MSAPWYYPLLACPDCGADLSLRPSGVACEVCRYERELASPLDLRPRSPRPVTLEFPRRLSAYPADDLGGVSLDRPAITYRGPRAKRDSRELLSALAPFLPGGARVLDLGCGPADQREAILHLGWQYVGVDFDGPGADILADGHALPFRDGSLDGILSYAVLEHLYNPHVALREAHRVLRPGGVFCGTVSQGEPFHSSFFHMTTWAVLALFDTMRWRVHRVWPGGETLSSLALMGRYPRVVKALLSLVAGIHHRFPWLAPRRLRWSRREKQLDELHRAASICFLAQKAPEGGAGRP